METDQAFRIFLSFVYPELKSFSLNFLTLVSGVLAFSVTFADKVLGITGGFSRRHLPLFGAWSMFLCSIALTGYGLWRLFGAAEVAQGWPVLGNRAAIVSRTYQAAYWSLNLAGFSFIVGMFFLAVSGVVAALSRSARGTN